MQVFLFHLVLHRITRNNAATFSQRVELLSICICWPKSWSHRRQKTRKVLLDGTGEISKSKSLNPGTDVSKGDHEGRFCSRNPERQNTAGWQIRDDSRGPWRIRFFLKGGSCLESDWRGGLCLWCSSDGSGAWPNRTAPGSASPCALCRQVPWKKKQEGIGFMLLHLHALLLETLRFRVLVGISRSGWVKGQRQKHRKPSTLLWKSND